MQAVDVAWSLVFHSPMDWLPIRTETTDNCFDYHVSLHMLLHCVQTMKGEKITENVYV